MAWQYNPDTDAFLLLPDGEFMETCCCECITPELRSVCPQDGYHMTISPWSIRVDITYNCRFTDRTQLWMRSLADFTWRLKTTDLTPVYSAAWSGHIIQTPPLAAASAPLDTFYQWYLLLYNDCGKTYQMSTRTMWVKKYTSWPPAGCNGCSPTLHTTYIVVLSGLGGTMAIWNGTHTVTHTTGCIWRLSPGPTVDGSLQLNWVTPANLWRVTVSRTSGGICFVQWDGSTSPCNVYGPYATRFCNFADCPGAPCTGAATVS